MLGDSNYNYNNDNNKEKKYNPNITSDYKFTNPEGIDPSALTFSFWNGLLCIKIAPKKASTNSDEFTSYDYENAAAVYLSAGKARIFAEEIKKFMANPGKITEVGVQTKKGLVSIADGKTVGVDCPILIIRELSESTGEVVAKYIYQFKTGKYYFAIENFDESNPTGYDVSEYKSMEVDMLITLLEEYHRSNTGAIAASVINANKYNDMRVKNSLDAIKEKLGIATNTSGSYSKSGGGNFFRNNQSNNNSYNSIRDKVSGMDELD